MNRTLTIAVFVLCWGSCQLPARAHPRLSEFVQHEVSAKAGSTYIDVTVRLTFFDRLSASQEVLLDRDGDGEFGYAELALFRTELLKTVENQITLHVSDQPLELLPLFDPEIKVESPQPKRARNGRFDVVLHFFARLPDGLRDGAPLEIHDGLYPRYAAIAQFHVAGEDGVRLSAVGDGHDLGRQADAAAPLVLRALFEAAPSKSFESASAKPIDEGEQE